MFCSHIPIIIRILLIDQGCHFRSCILVRVEGELWEIKIGSDRLSSVKCLALCLQLAALLTPLSSVQGGGHSPHKMDERVKKSTMNSDSVVF